MSALKRKIARGGTGGQQSNKDEVAADPAAAAAASRKAATRIDLDRAGLYNDKEVPETPQQGVSVGFEHRVVPLRTIIRL